MNSTKIMASAVLLLMLSSLLGCVVGTDTAVNDQPEVISTTLAIDDNPDPNIFETTITAAPHKMTLASGETVSVFGYNGQVPGPEIRVNRGNRVIVHFKNQLPKGYATTIHWHGIELNNKSDGAEPVNSGETYVYDFLAPRAGVFWYHPHIRGTEEVAAGLYAPFIVSQPEESQLVAQNRLPKRELTLVLSDLAVEHGQLRDLANTDMLETMNGTEGNILLVNGKQFPSISVEQGEGVRLRLINASIARYYRLVLPGHDIYRVGGQGGLLSAVALEGGVRVGMRMPMDDTYTGYTGAIEINQGYKSGEIMLAPAERADVVIIPKAKAGESVVMQWADFARGRHMMAMNMATPATGGHTSGHDASMPMDDMTMAQADDDGLRASIDILRINVRPSTRQTGVPFQIKTGDALVAAIPALVAQRTEKPLKLQEDMEAIMAGAAKNTWFKIDDFSGVEGRSNYRTSRVGEIIDWETHNDTAMHHPFHQHGFSFQPTGYLYMNHEAGYMDMWDINDQHEYVDTLDIPPHTSVLYTLEVKGRPGIGAGINSKDGSGVLGDWMLHCHIFQHGENGMMSFLRVE